MTAIAEQLERAHPNLTRQSQLYFLEKGLASKHGNPLRTAKALAANIQNNPALLRELWAKVGLSLFVEIEKHALKYAQDREAERRGDASDVEGGASRKLPEEARVAVPRSSQTIPAGAVQGEAVRDREGIGRRGYADGRTAVAHPPRDTNDDAAGRIPVADTARHQVPAASSPQLNGGGQSALANNGLPTSAPSREAEAPPLGHNKPPRFLPGHARRGASSIAAVQHVAAKTLLDTFKVRDGRVIGDLLFRELEGLRAANAKEAAVLRAVQHHVANAEPTHRVRDIVSPDTFAAIVAQAEEEARAA